jgi:holliday junction DNA helicase RuvA
MISAVTGELRRVDEDRVHVQCGAMLFELLVPAADVLELQQGIGRELTFHTILYMEGDATRGNLEPRMIGFLRPGDRKFFEKFTTVKGVGVKTALKALTEPVGQIAQAIESKDTRYLLRLKGVGKRTAELIVAELAGKLKDFATGYGEKAPAGAGRVAYEEEAIMGLIALGEARAVAERLMELAKQANPALKTAGALLREMLQMRTMRT